MKITTYKQAREYLENLIRFTIYQKIRDDKHLKDPLERMRVLLKLLGNPETKFKSVLVGGTSGKGSTAYLISHMLTTARYKTGFFMKPHLQKINERIQVNELYIADKILISMLNDIISVVNKMKKMRVGQPSYFELLVAIAFQYFAKKQVDIAIVEVGLGGEYDASNTLEPLISVLTKVSLDHTEFLGKTVQRIAETKAGIIKKYQVESIKYKGRSITEPIVVTGVKQSSVIKIVKDRCNQVGSPMYRLGKDFDYKIHKEDVSGSVFDFKNKTSGINNLHLKLIGAYQVENASLAIETVLQLRNFGFKVSLQNIRNALQAAFFPGRFEIVRGPAYANASAGKPVSGVYPEQGRRVGSPSTFATPRNHKPYAIDYTLVLDGAHNPEKMRAFITSLNNIFPRQKKIFILAFKKTKDIASMLRYIVSCAETIVVTRFTSTTDMMKNPAMEVARIKNQVLSIKGAKRVRIFSEEETEQALRKTFREANKDSIIVVTGSLYLVGEVRALLGLKYSTEKVGN